jgi:peroxiredoxin
LAAFQERLDEIQATGVRIIALSVDKEDYSTKLKEELGLTFRILCDTEREVVKGWDRFNKFELGGIAKPALFIIDTDRTIRFRSDGKTSSRYGVEDLLKFLLSGNTMADFDVPVRKPVVPRLSQTWGTLKSWVARHLGG